MIVSLPTRPAYNIASFLKGKSFKTWATTCSTNWHAVTKENEGYLMCCQLFYQVYPGIELTPQRTILENVLAIRKMTRRELAVRIEDFLPGLVNALGGPCKLAEIPVEDGRFWGSVTAEEITSPITICLWEGHLQGVIFKYILPLPSLILHHPSPSQHIEYLENQGGEWKVDISRPRKASYITGMRPYDLNHGHDWIMERIGRLVERKPLGIAMRLNKEGATVNNHGTPLIELIPEKPIVRLDEEVVEPPLNIEAFLKGVIARREAAEQQRIATGTHAKAYRATATPARKPWLMALDLFFCSYLL